MKKERKKFYIKDRNLLLKRKKILIKRVEKSSIEVANEGKYVFSPHILSYLTMYRQKR